MLHRKQQQGPSSARVWLEHRCPPSPRSQLRAELVRSQPNAVRTTASSDLPEELRPCSRGYSQLRQFTQDGVGLLPCATQGADTKVRDTFDVASRAHQLTELQKLNHNVSPHLLPGDYMRGDRKY